MLADKSHDAFLLLAAWRDFLVVLAKNEPLPVTKEDKTVVMKGIMKSLLNKLTDADEKASCRLLILLSELYLMLLQNWESNSFINLDDWSNSLNELLDKVASNAADIHPRLQLAVVAIGTVALSIITKAKDKDINDFHLREWVTSGCLLLKEMAAGTQQSVKLGDDNGLKLAVVTICFLKELVSSMKSPEQWLDVIQFHTIIPSLVGLLIFTLQLQKGLILSHAILEFFLVLATFPKAAEILTATSLMSEIILLLSATYMGEKVQPLLSARNLAKNQISWLGIYSSCMRLVAVLLHTQRHFFLQDALNFVGVHLERMYQALQQVRSAPTSSDVQEAVITCHVVYQMSFNQQMWRLEHPTSLSLLIGAVCDSCHAAVAYLIRPSLLQHVIDAKLSLSQEKGSPFLNVEEEAKKLRRLSSVDDIDKPTPDLVNVQSKLLALLSVGLSTLRLFTPNMYGMLSDQAIDVDQWHLLLHISFSTPSIDQEGPLSFGSILSCINMCSRSLTKNEHTASPGRSPQPEGPLPVEREMLLYVLETSLVLLLSQAILALLHPGISPRDKQLVRRELGAELNSVMSDINRYLRRGAPLSPAGPSSSLVSPGQQRLAQSDWPFIRFVSILVDKLSK